MARRLDYNSSNHSGTGIKLIIPNKSKRANHSGTGIKLIIPHKSYGAGSRAVANLCLLQSHVRNHIQESRWY